MGSRDISSNEVSTVVGRKNYRTPDGYTCDMVVFAVSQHETKKVLLIKRKELKKDGTKNIEGGKWALPGGFVEYGETAIEAAKRELFEETNVEGVQPFHFGVYDEPGRDPRGWIIANAHYAMVNEEALKGRCAGDDAKETELFAISEALDLDLAFDHNKILRDALKAIKVVHSN